MRHFVLLISVYWLGLEAWAQDFPSDLWHNGKVVLLTKETLQGAVKYDLQNDLVQININNQLQTYSARKINYVEIFDETVKSTRTFFALPYQVQVNYEVPILFEVLYEGKLTLLCREELVTESMQAYNPYMPYSYYPGYGGTRQRLAYRFYFLDERGKIIEYNMKKGELLQFFRKKQQEIKQYIKKNNLKHDRMRDLVRITAYYNALLGA
jgi:hypothetical protein